MKFQKIISIFSLLVLSTAIVFAQDGKNSDYEAHWAGIDVGTVILMNDEFGTDFSGPTWNDYHPYWENDIAKSSTISFNMFEYKLPIFRQYIGLTTGFGYRNTNVAFRNNYQLEYNEDYVFANSMNLEQEGISEVKQNYLAAHYFTVPLLLEFATKVEGKKCFYFNAGVVGGVRFASSTTLKGTYDNGDKFTNVRRAKYNLNPFLLDASFRIGYGAFGIFGSYSLSTMFKQNKTAAVHPLRVGISWNWHFAGGGKKEESDFDFEDAIEEL